MLSLGEMVEVWLDVTRVRKRVMRLPLPGAVAAAFRAGKNTVPDGVRGEVRWRDWLTRRMQSGQFLRISESLGVGNSASEHARQAHPGVIVM